MNHELILLVLGSLVGSVIMFLTIVFIDARLRQKRWEIQAAKNRIDYGKN